MSSNNINHNIILMLTEPVILPESIHVLIFKS